MNNCCERTRSNHPCPSVRMTNPSWNNILFLCVLFFHFLGSTSYRIYGYNIRDGTQRQEHFPSTLRVDELKVDTDQRCLILPLCFGSMSTSMHVHGCHSLPSLFASYLLPCSYCRHSNSSAKNKVVVSVNKTVTVFFFICAYVVHRRHSHYPSLAVFTTSYNRHRQSLPVRVRVERQMCTNPRRFDYWGPCVLV